MPYHCHKILYNQKNPSLRNTNLMKLHSILLYDCSSSVSKLYPVDQIWPLTCFFVNRILLKYRHIHSFLLLSAFALQKQTCIAEQRRCVPQHLKCVLSRSLKKIDQLLLQITSWKFGCKTRLVCVCIITLEFRFFSKDFFLKLKRI